MMTDQEVNALRATKKTQFFYGFGSISVGIKNNLLGHFPAYLLQPGPRPRCHADRVGDGDCAGV